MEIRLRNGEENRSGDDYFPDPADEIPGVNPPTTDTP